MARIKDFQSTGNLSGLTFEFRSRGVDWIGCALATSDATQIWVKGVEGMSARMALEVPPNSIKDESDLLDVISRADVAIALDDLITEDDLDFDIDEDLDDNGAFLVEDGDEGTIFSINLGNIAGIKLSNPFR